ncbi:PAS domain S-box protein [Neosynechococcus sphagnicola]|uniref:PAS domain S-box protein n=1 Tax=Neosynechococcus sphagnicola TaxID=1501145 RepID=UPI00068E7DBD|nr:PAS domain S-box protein [Neosynechococcus sphagnicola]
MLCIIDAQGNFQKLNPAWEKNLGFSKMELRSQSYLTWVHPDDHALTLAQVQALQETAGTSCLENRYRCKEGAYKWLSWTMTSFGSAGLVYCVVRDITPRKRAEQESWLLQTLTQAISESQDFLTGLKVALQKVCEVTGWDYGEAWLPRRDGTRLERTPAWYGRGDDLADFNRLSTQMTFKPGVGIPGQVWLSKQPLWIQDVTTEPSDRFSRSQAAIAHGLKAGLGIPMIAENDVLAVLLFFMVLPRSEDQRWIELVSTVAVQLSVLMKRKQVEEKYRSIYENSITGIFQTTPDGHYLSTNRALARIYGYECPQELVKNLCDIEHQLYVDPERRHHFAESMRQHGAVTKFESQVYRRDGSTIWISENAREVRDSEGHLLYYEGNVEDITDRKLAEQALQAAEAKNRALLNAIPDLMLRLHRDGTYLDFKAPLDFQTLRTGDVSIGQNFLELLPPEIAQQRMHYLQRALQTGDVQIFEYQLPINELNRDFEARMVVSGEDEVTMIVRDITERKRMDRLKNEFVSVVSHELRTPLTSIRGSLGLIVGGVVGEIPAQAQSLVEIAHKNQ